MKHTLKIETTGDKCRIEYAGREVLRHTPRKPLVEVGTGQTSYRMSHGNFKIKPGLRTRTPLTGCRVVSSDETGARLEFAPQAVAEPVVALALSVADTGLTAELRSLTDQTEYDRVFLRFPAREREPIFGGGEQYSRLNLRGSRLPLWTSEQGVGRAHNLTTFLANRDSDAGGFWHSTYFPQPTFVAASGRFLHFESSAYTVADFSRPEEDVIEVWQRELTFHLGVAEDMLGAISTLSDILGRQPRLPEWADKGMWLGLQGGSETIRTKTAVAREAGIPVSALWVQDWEGKRETAFGRQLFWDWKYSTEMYPDLPELLTELKRYGTRFLGYINPFLAIEGDLYKEARDKGYCIKNPDGSDYLITVTTFPAALIDLTNPAARTWIKTVIKEHMLAVGLSGWMADYGEYLPTDAVLHDGDAQEFHNRYPAEWARVNYEALLEADTLDDTVIFMRAGFSGSSGCTHSLWAGDQLVDWSRHDGLPSVIPAALSAGFCGIGVHHSDVGGFTTLFHKKRGKELFQRWAEQSAFTPIMRTHEGNRPDSNWQWDSDDETMTHLARMARIYVALRPYRRAVLDEYYARGIPAQRPVFLHYPQWFDVPMRMQQYTYLFGRDLFVAPVLRSGVRTVRTVVPPGRWVHLWTEREFNFAKPAWVRIAAPLGEPPVFYRRESSWKELFGSIARGPK